MLTRSIKQLLYILIALLINVICIQLIYIYIYTYGSQLNILIIFLFIDEFSVVRIPIGSN